MKCTEFDFLLNKFFDKDLQEKELKDFNNHIEHCPRCLEEFNSMKIIIDELEIDEFEVAEELDFGDGFTLQVMAKVQAYEIERQLKLKKFENIAYISSMIICLCGIAMWSMFFSNFNIITIKHGVKGLLELVIHLADRSVIFDFIIYFLNTVNLYIPSTLAIIGVGILIQSRREVKKEA